MVQHRGQDPLPDFDQFDRPGCGMVLSLFCFLVGLGMFLGAVVHFSNAQP